MVKRKQSKKKNCQFEGNERTSFATTYVNEDVPVQFFSLLILSFCQRLCTRALSYRYHEANELEEKCQHDQYRFLFGCSSK